MSRGASNAHPYFPSLCAGAPICSDRAVTKGTRSNTLEKKDKDGKRSKLKLPDLRAGIHGEVTSGGLLGDGYRDPLAIEDSEVLVSPGSKLPTGQTTRE
jgi:hypothetical protein